MRVISYLFFVFSLIGFKTFVSSMQPTQRIVNLKRDLNERFGRPPDSDLFVVTITRSPVSGSVSLISHNEFEQLLRLLYASCANPRRLFRGRGGAAFPPLYNRRHVILGTDRDISDRERKSIDLTAKNIAAYFTSNCMRNACKLVVFNEMFFSQAMPLNTEQKEFIERKLLRLSGASPYSIFYPNFLYTEVRRKRGRDVYADLLSMGKHAGSDGLNVVRSVVQRTIPGWGAGENPENTTMVFGDAIRALARGVAHIVRTVPNDDNFINQEYLLNETYAIWHGERVTKTTKVGYFKECDPKISQGCLYASGMGLTEGLATNNDRAVLQNILLRDISLDICLDLNLGIRRSIWNSPSRRTDWGVESYLHIVQSSSIDPFFNLVNRRNLPVLRGIVHADTFPYPSWSSPNVGRPQNIYLPYINEDGSMLDSSSHREEFSVRISESDYRFSFLKV